MCFNCRNCWCPPAVAELPRLPPTVSRCCRVVSAACVRQPACLVPAVNAVFDDPCPGAAKALAFGFRCVPESSLPPAPPE